jgi:hypothetical protein
MVAYSDGQDRHSWDLRSSCVLTIVVMIVRIVNMRIREKVEGRVTLSGLPVA